MRLWTNIYQLAKDKNLKNINQNNSKLMTKRGILIIRGHKRKITDSEAQEHIFAKLLDHFHPHFFFKKYPVLQLKNTFNIDNFNFDDKFLITRLGYNGSETVVTYLYSVGQLDKLFMHDHWGHRWSGAISNNAGIYPYDKYHMGEFAKRYLKAIINSTFIKFFPINFLPEYHLITLNGNYNTDIPINRTNWFNKLKGKRLLIISSFVDTMKKQWESGRVLKANNAKPIDLTIKYIKMPYSICGERPHQNWLQTFDSVCDQIKDVEFDIALVSAGGYGLPICNYVYEELGKSAIYVGGDLQTYFCIKGKRWNDRKIYNKFWINCSDSEKPKNLTKVEGGCYWM